MRHGHSVAPIILALALFLPPLLNVGFKLIGLHQSAEPETLTYGSGTPDKALKVPAGYRRGDYLPARVIHFSTPSTYRSTYFLTVTPSRPIYPGTAVIAPPWTLAGVVVSVWPQTGVALVKNLDDPLFFVSCMIKGEVLDCQGIGQGLGLKGVLEDSMAAPLAEVSTSGRGHLFPPGLLVGSLDADGQTIRPAFTPDNTPWAYLWFDSDAERVKKQIKRGLSP